MSIGTRGARFHSSSMDEIYDQLNQLTQLQRRTEAKLAAEREQYQSVRQRLSALTNEHARQSLTATSLAAHNSGVQHNSLNINACIQRVEKQGHSRHQFRIFFFYFFDFFDF